MPDDCPPLLHMQRWARNLGQTVSQHADTAPQLMQHLALSLNRRATPMAHSVATGEGLVSNGHLGVDVIQLDAGTGFEPHTHPGDHLLIVVGGLGTVTYDGRIYPTEAGQVYLVPGAVPHAVGAITNHVILAVGAPHMPVGSPARMQPVAYQAVLAHTQRLHCLLCNLVAEYPIFLHACGCSHCPCAQCVTSAPAPTHRKVTRASTTAP